MEINRLELRVLLFILLVQRDSCPLFPKSLWRNRKGRKNPHCSGLARFKYQPLLAFHWCSAVFGRLFWEPLQHMNLQSAGTYAEQLNVFFFYEEPLRASLSFLHRFRPLPALPLAFNQSSVAEMRHCHCYIPNSFCRWTCCMYTWNFLLLSELHCQKVLYKSLPLYPNEIRM